MAKDDISKQLNKLKDKGISIWSNSRLNTFNTCQYEYYMNYILKLESLQNVYGTMGGIIHDSLQNIHDGNATELDMLTEYLAGLNKCKLFGIEFPAEYIEKSWKLDMNHFMHSFKRLDGKHTTEHGFIFELDGNVLTGFIDEIREKDNTVEILDWKTSSEFKGDKLQEAGRQLLIYALAYESEHGRKPDRVGWYMLKYLYIDYDGKTKMVARRNAVKDIKGLINTQLKKMGYSESDRDLLIIEAVNNNNLSNMPKQVQDRFKYRDCILYYLITEENILELKSYIKNTVTTIHNKDEKNEEEWLPKENPKEDFYCMNLCGHKKHCKFYLY